MSLVESGWRRFNFFDKQLVTDPDRDEEQAFLGLQDLDPICSVSGNGLVFFGETTGGVCRLSTKSLGVDYWKAYKVSLADMALVSDSNILVTVGVMTDSGWGAPTCVIWKHCIEMTNYVERAHEDEPGTNSLLKVWRLERTSKDGPFCCRILRVGQQLVNKTARTCCVQVHSRLDFMAVGFDDSSVLLYKGDVSKDKQSQKPLVVREGASSVQRFNGPITGLFIQILSDHRLLLFVASNKGIFSYVYKDREVDKKNVHDAKGCERNCCTMGEKALDFQFIVARKDMVYLYDPEQCCFPDEVSNGKCHGFERDKNKLLIRVSGPYLCLVTDNSGPIDTGNESQMDMLTIYDIPGQYVAYIAPIPQIVDVFVNFASFFVLCKNGKLFKIVEKDIQTKLDVLFRKNLYDVAIGIAKRHYCEETHLIEIFKRHGDYLYTKADYENSVQQYIQTIGMLEPSYVIRKFLDASRISQLTAYLESVHSSGLGTSDHTTILLNCYIKLQNADKIGRFIADSKFDVDTAIKILRSSNYTREALQLAEKHDKNDIYLQILVENAEQHRKAVEHISQLPLDKAEKCLKKYGKALLSKAPQETTRLLRRLCTGIDGRRVSADQFVHIFLDEPEQLREFLEHLTQEGDSECSNTFYNTLLELYLRERKAGGNFDHRIIALLNDSKSPYQNQVDLDQALVLCQMYDFGPGIVFVYEKMKMYQDILQYHMNRNNFDEVLKVCQLYGEKDMWLEVLWFVAKHDDIPSGMIADLLRNIDEHDILPPLMVLEILSHSRVISLGLIKDYLLQWLKKENAQIANDEALIEEYKRGIDKFEHKIDDLQYNPQLFRMSKCTACDTPLEVPTVHFLCKHSYHRHCFESYSENSHECPACLPENKKLRALLKTQVDSNLKESYQQFKSELNSSKDTMSVVAAYFAKGIYQSGEESQPSCSLFTESTSKVNSKSTNPFDEDD